MAKIDPGLVKAVKEYHRWHGGKSIRPVRIIQNKYSNPPQEMLLVRFTDEDNDKLSCLMEFMGWKDGHYDVTEIDHVYREYEDELVEEFEESREFESVIEEE